MAHSHAALTVHVAAPRERLATWCTWARHAGPLATVVSTPLVAAQLSRWSGGGAVPPVAWYGDDSATDPHALWADVLAPALEDMLPPTSPYRGTPGAASAVLRAARVLHDQRVPVGRLGELSPALAEALTRAADCWTRVAWGLSDGQPVRWALTGEGPLAVYGAIPAAREWVLDQSRQRPVHVFLALADGTAGVHASGTTLAWWRRQGAQVLDTRPAHPPTTPSRRIVAVARPDDIRWAVAEALAGTDVHQDALVVAPWGSAAALARDLRGLGWSATAYPPPLAPSPGLAAWEASVERAPLAPLMEWARTTRGAAADRERLFQHAGHPTRWPPAVRAAHDAMTAARAALLAARDWTTVGRQAVRWAAAAGLSLGQADPALARWHAAGVPPAPVSIEAWLLARLSQPLPVPADASVWVVETDAAAAGFTPSTLILLTDADDPGVTLGPDDVPAVLTERVRAELGLETAAARRMAARTRRDQLVALSERLWVVVDETSQGSQAENVPRVEAPRHDGTGLGVALGRSQPRFGAFDGRFPPEAVPAPRSASGFERYGRCPLQYAWRALGVEPMPAPSAEPDARSVGSWMHRVLAEAAGQVPPPSPAAVRELLDRAVEEDPPAATVLPGLLAGRLDAMVADLVAVLAASPPEGRLATELSWDLTWRDAALKGVMDRVEQRPDGTVLVVDYKSGDPPAATVHPTRLQLALYAYAASTTVHVPLEAVSAAYWGITSRKGFARKVLKPPMADRWAEADAIMEGVYARVHAGELFMFPGAGACRTCDWRTACPGEAEALGRQKGRTALEFVRLWPDRGEEDADADAPD